MGCASSKVLGSEFTVQKGSNGYARGISMPTTLIHHPECPDDFHIVALTSSTYGILKVDSPKLPEEAERKEGTAPHSVKEVLNKLNSLESKADAGPQSWLEVSSMLENFKPGLETAPPNNPKPPKFGKASKPTEQLDSIDINEIMMDIDEDTGLLKPKASVARRANLKKAGNSLPIRTLEELDKRNGQGKGNSTTKQNPPPVTTDFRALLKPIRTGNAKTEVSKESLKGSTLESDRLKVTTPAISMPDMVVKKDSELFDDDLLESYKEAFPNLSDDDWKVLELQEDAEFELKHGVQGTEAVGMMDSHTEATEDQLPTSFPQADASQRKFSKERGWNDEEAVISDRNSLSTESLESVAKASPLESYEELCPPGGKHAVVLYTTSLRGIRKTYEDCMRVRDIVKSYGVLIDERDVSMHLEYRNELRELMQRLVTVPRLFINGKYIGGAETVCKLQEEAQLACLFEGSTKVHCNHEGACDGCANARFVPYFECNGSCKIVDDKRQVARCSQCNENGLVQCPICS